MPKSRVNGILGLQELWRSLLVESTLHWRWVRRGTNLLEESD